MTHLPWRRSPAAGPAAEPIRRGLLVLAALGAVLAAGATAQAAESGPILSVAESGLTLSDAWMRSIIPSRPAAGYFTLSNDGAEARTLVGAASPACGMLMLHRSVHESGEDRMEMVKSVSVPAHGTVRFAPGGYHLMCTSPSKAVTPGGSVPVTLRFADGGTVTARFPVRGAMGK